MTLLAMTISHGFVEFIEPFGFVEFIEPKQKMKNQCLSV